MVRSVSRVVEVAFGGDVGPAGGREVFHQGRGRLGAEVFFEAQVELVAGVFIDSHGGSPG